LIYCFSFNPCFPGSSAESAGIRRTGNTWEAVSILVFLDQALKVIILSIWTRRLRVSILVFLDQALKVDLYTSAWGEWACFNPCFPGSSAESRHHHAGHYPYLIVSILVFLDQALKAFRKPHSPARPAVSILVFLDQALKVFGFFTINPSYLCFNPCFPGSSAESETYIDAIWA